jgi:hypothetical protein
LSSIAEFPRNAESGGTNSLRGEFLPGGQKPEAG